MTDLLPYVALTLGFALGSVVGYYIATKLKLGERLGTIVALGSGTSVSLLALVSVGRMEPWALPIAALLVTGVMAIAVTIGRKATP